MRAFSFVQGFRLATNTLLASQEWGGLFCCGIYNYAITMCFDPDLKFD